ncbi:MAG TPA: hypothetical protein VNI77_01715 [Nitrososphaera sp.]|nr:hypothetical protein [Nitrososphaera sp.]
MSRSLVIALIVVATALIAVVGFAIFGGRQTEPIRISESQSGQQGASVVVLIDFSKSFPASYRSDGSMVYGFRLEDHRALDALVTVLAELASGTPTFKTVWTQIQTSSITQNPVCPPIEMTHGIIKREHALTTREQLRDTLKKCVATVMLQGKDQNKLGNFTDISGAIAMAADIGSAQYTERILVIISDFLEDLPPGSTPAHFQLNGERVVLLHRPGTDEQENISAYLSRIQGWKQKLLQHGAKTVASLPVFAVSETRLRAALRQEELGSSLTILVDCKENRFPSSSSSGTHLVRIGRTLAELSRDMPTPVTALWMSMGTSGFFSKTLPFVEFHPRMIKRDNSMNTVEDFTKVMEELAHSLPSICRGTTSTDISGSLALVCSVDPPAKSSVLLVISDFLDEGAPSPAPFQLAPGTRVVMIHAASSKDHSDPNAFLARRQAWEKRFLESGATSVCQIPLITFTRNDLRACLGAKARGK